MKFFSTIKKNFKVLFRLRLSLIAIILGPLLVLTLIGIAFNSSSNIQLTIGYNAPDNSPLTLEFIQTLKLKDFTLKSYESQSSCIKELQLGLTHTCIIFPKDFNIEKNKANNITFYVDKSRVNIAYNVIDSVSENIGIKSDELSKSLTDTLTNTLSSTSEHIDETLGIIIKVKKNIEDAGNDAQSVSSDLSGMDLQVDKSIDTSSDINKLASYTSDLTDEINSAKTTGHSLINDLQATASGNQSTDLDSLETLLTNLDTLAISKNNKSDVLSTQLVSDTLDKVKDIEAKFDEAKKLNENSRGKISSLKNNLNNIASDINRAKLTLEGMVNDINTIEITSSDQIVNPIHTKIETIASENNQIVILFPYVLMLIIMFVGMMLSSTLVIVEKKSKASFRIFTTPTMDEFFILTTFVTAFIIVAIQTTMILIAANFLVPHLITANLGLNMIIISLAAAIFIMIGMAMGYLLPNQQATNMASISVGAIFLFISNMVLPLETISPYLQHLASYNPYVIASEVLRRSILFAIPITDSLHEIMILVLYSIFVAFLIIMFQRLSKIRYFKKNPQKKSSKKVSFSHEYLYIKTKKITSEKEFIKEIKKLSDKEYLQFRLKNHKDMNVFIGEKLNKEGIAKRVSRLNRSQILAEFGEANVKLMEHLKPKSQKKKKKK